MRPKVRGRDVGIAVVAFLVGSAVGGAIMVDADAYDMGYDIGFAEGRDFERDATPAEPLDTIPLVILVSVTVPILGLIVWLMGRTSPGKKRREDGDA